MKKIFLPLTLAAIIVAMSSNASFAQSTLTNVWEDFRNFNQYDAGTLVETFYNANTQSNHMISVAIVNNYAALNITHRDESGVIQWSKTKNKPGLSYWSPNRLIVDETGSVIVAGSVYNSNLFRYEIFVMKLNALGVSQWIVRHFDEESYLVFTGLEGDGAGSYYLSYWYTEYDVNGDITSEVSVLKLNGTDGSTIWETEQEFPDQYTATNAMIYDGSGIYLTGYISNATFGYDIITLKFDLNGNFAWQQVYSTGGQFAYSVGWDLAINSDGEIVVAALAQYNRILAIGYSANGNQEFVNTKTFSNNSYAYNLQMADDGNGATYLAAQVSQGINYKIFLEQLDNDGIKIWQKTINVDYLTRMKADPAGQGVWVLGSFYDSNALNYFSAIYHIDQSGSTSLSYQFEEYSGYNGVADFDTPDGVSVFLVGSHPGNQFYTDELTARWDVTSSKLAQSSSVSNALIYPNPCFDYAFIQSAADADAVLIYDLAGRLIANYADVTDAVEINTNTWDAGTYLVKIITGSEQQVMKLIKE